MFAWSKNGGHQNPDLRELNVHGIFECQDEVVYGNDYLFMGKYILPL